MLNIKSLKLDAACLAKLPATEASPAAPRTLAQWQSMLPNTWINIDNVILAPWPEWQGKLAISMTPVIQQIRYQGEKVKISRAATRSGIDGEPTGDRRAGQPASR
ncbi:DctA Dicarboxylate transport [Salmonella enterica subsp. enterica]|uniref:DctA Dicarboxylate transport n=1 Tax=Salmonella enterica I TaxID=59201 RepID=A0A447U2L5_SALET|nr:DctA Dicarboxylate transport [Salmonella enterica subsp. enterica]